MGGLQKIEGLVDKDRFFGVRSAYKRGDIFWTCVKDDIIEEKDDYKAIGLCSFDSGLFEEEVGGVVQKLL